jgi:uncharacterized glyoxalase superfamily protein PhnB
MAPKLSRIAPEIPVLNLGESIEYYEKKLGFHLAMQMPGIDYAIVERSDIAIHLFHDGTRSYSPVAIHIFTSDLETLHAELLERGAQLSQGILQKPWGNRDFRVSDNSGNELKFTEPIST